MNVADIRRNRHQRYSIVEVQLQIIQKGHTLLSNLWKSLEVRKNLLMRIHKHN